MPVVKKTPAKRKATPKKAGAQDDENDDEQEEPTTPKPAKKRTPKPKKEKGVKGEVSSVKSSYKTSASPSQSRRYLISSTKHSLTELIRRIAKIMVKLLVLSLPRLLHLPRSVL